MPNATNSPDDYDLIAVSIRPQSAKLNVVQYSPIGILSYYNRDAYWRLDNLSPRSSFQLWFTNNLELRNFLKGLNRFWLGTVLEILALTFQNGLGDFGLDLPEQPEDFSLDLPEQLRYRGGVVF
ncbi:unnamed protein product [Rhizophagus irregularis]|nr:unnamed protein product [Rhizophagus irregularis]